MHEETCVNCAHGEVTSEGSIICSALTDRVAILNGASNLDYVVLMDPSDECSLFEAKEEE